MPCLTSSKRAVGVTADAIAAGLAGRNVGVRSGHMYSPRLLGRLGLLPDGIVRASLVHYTTHEEIFRFRNALVDVIADAGAHPR
jgi:selenocysteine lyase/cysteine desulfurase